MIDSVTFEDYPQLLNVWESAVKNTHHFLSAEDFDYYKSQIPIYLPHLKLYAYENEKNEIRGFIGVSGVKIEMLFVDNTFRGMGIGRKLVNFALENLNASKVDVNEQNEQAIGFYKHLGFEIIGRSKVDGVGKNYPILHMEYRSIL